MSKRYLDAIHNFFDNNNGRALMIDGAWGSGKTYFVKEVLLQSLKEKGIKTLYISLYGHNDLDSITSAIYNNMLMYKTNKFFPIIPYGERMITALADVNEKVKFASTILNINRKTLVELFNETSNYLIIFDDLERSSLGYEIVLGYINNLCEQVGNQIIIVANEKEIATVLSSSELPIRYQTALLAKDYEFDLPESQLQDLISSKKQENDSNTKINNKADLIAKTSSIFDMDTKYEVIKEKIVEKTISFKPNLSEVFDSLLNIHTTKVIRILKPRKSEIIELFETKGNSNIRTLQFFFSTFRQFSDLIEGFKTIDNDKYSEFLDTITINIAYSVINYKNGGKRNNWSKMAEFGYTELEDPLINPRYYSFKFIEDYIWDSTFNPTISHRILEAYFYKQSTPKKDPLHQLSMYWVLEDEEVEEIIKKIINGIENHKYPVTSYVYIITYFVKLKEIGFEIDLDNVIKIMEASAKDAPTSFENFYNHEINLNNESLNILQELTEKINMVTKSKDEVNIKGDLFQLLETQNWADSVHPFFLKHQSFFIDNKGFLQYFDMNQLFKKLDESNTSDFSNFRRVIASIFDRKPIGERYKMDQQNLIRLNAYLESKAFDSLTKEMNREIFSKLIKEVVDNFERSTIAEK